MQNSQLFGYMIAVYAFAFIAAITFDTDQRLPNIGRSGDVAVAPPERTPATPGVLNAQQPVDQPEMQQSKDI